MLRLNYISHPKKAVKNIKIHKKLHFKIYTLPQNCRKQVVMLFHFLLMTQEMYNSKCSLLKAVFLKVTFSLCSFCTGNNSGIYIMFKHAIGVKVYVRLQENICLKTLIKIFTIRK